MRLLPWFCLALCLLAPVGCKKQPAALVAVRVTKVTISDGSAPSAEPTSAQEVTLLNAVQRGLTRAGVPVALTPTEPGPGDFQLRLQLQVQELQEQPEKAAPQPATDKRVLRVICGGLLSARQRGRLVEPTESGDNKESSGPPPVELSKLEHVGVTQKPLAPGQPSPSPAEILVLVERLLEDTAFTLGSELHLLSTDSRSLMALASQPAADPELRQTAVQLLGQRKERLALPVLIALVKERDPASALTGTPESPETRMVRRGLRDAAIGALVELGDQSAVRPLLDSVAFRDYAEMGKVLEAVASLGGDEARRYLQFVRSSHPEPAIRKEAEAALDHLEKRSKPPGAQPGAPADAQKN